MASTGRATRKTASATTSASSAPGFARPVSRHPIPGEATGTRTASKRSTSGRSCHMKILLVLTSHDTLGNTGRKTGFWLEEGAAPYYVFRDAGVTLTLAPPKGGQPPCDPKSDLAEN